MQARKLFGRLASVLHLAVMALASAALAAGADYQFYAYDTPSWVQFSDPEYLGTEGESLVVTVVRTGEYRVAAKVRYEIEQSGEGDFKSISGELLIQAGRGFGEIPLAPVLDELTEGEEVFTIRLFSDGPGVEVIGEPSAIKVRDGMPQTTTAGRELAIERGSEGGIRVKWRASLGEVRLVKKRELGDAGWQAVEGERLTDGTWIWVEEPRDEAGMFYRTE